MIKLDHDTKYKYIYTQHGEIKRLLNVIFILEHYVSNLIFSPFQSRNSIITTIITTTKIKGRRYIIYNLTTPILFLSIPPS